MATTRPSLDGYQTRPVGSFAGKPLFVGLFLPGSGAALVGLVGANPETARGEAEVLGDARGQILLPGLGVGIPSIAGPAIGRIQLPVQAIEELLVVGAATGQFTLVGGGDGTSNVLGDARGAIRLRGQGEA